MSGLFDQITNYSPPLLTAGQVNYKGTWDASANSPALTSPPAATSKGDYYVVSAAGTQFGITFAVGDWIISNGTAWEKVDLTDSVSSVFGRTGAVVGASTDYSSVGLTNTAIGASSPSTGAFTTVTASSTIAATGAVTGSNLSGTNTGDQTTITGNAGTATALQTARTIGGSSFDGTANVTSFPVPGAIGATTPAAGTFTQVNSTGAVIATGAGSFGDDVDVTGDITATATIQGGSIQNTPIGSTTPSTGAFTTLSATGAISGTTGAFTAGLAMDAATQVALNGAAGTLRAGYINAAITSTTDAFLGYLGTSSPLSGGTTGDLLLYSRGLAGTRTLVGAAGSVVGTFSSTGLAVTGVSSATSTGGGAGFSIVRTGGAPSTFTMLNSGGEIIHEYNAVGYGFNISTARVASISSTGLAVTGALSSTTGANFATSSGLVGIGTSSPAKLLHLSNADQEQARIRIQNTGAGGRSFDLVSGINAVSQSGFSIFDATAAATRLVIDSSGNVGIGTTSPATKLQVLGLENSNQQINSVGTNYGSGAYLNAFSSAGGNAQGFAGFIASQSLQTNRLYTGVHSPSGVNQAFIGTPDSNPLAFWTAGTERARIDSSGNLLVGTTSGVTNGGFSFEPNYNGTGISAAFFGHSSAGGSGNQYCVFAYNGAAIGSITQFGTTEVRYNTTSDYRRKSNVKDLTGSGTFIDALKPRTFDWDSGDKGVGFIAHEFAEVCPSAVTGEKDAVDADGKPVYQAMQASSAEVIANLVAELQSLRQRVAALESN